ncbi:glycerol channel [Diaporthe australafricana]|uniref:Glycerol channel n=1 Tax=Diaporthe australafricana TaxID=127596 RepID=A0ABR3XJH0_9PEZI
MLLGGSVTAVTMVSRHDIRHLHISAIDQYEGHAIRTIPPSSTTSAKIFCQFPQPFVPLGSQIFSEFIANFFTTFLILSVRDENGADLKGGGFFIIAFFWLNFIVMAAFGWETGSPINPARDLMGRTWLAILGYENAWSAYNYYFWIPTFVPFIACFFGALTYDIFIYTGDSPINNGAWSYGNFRNGIAQCGNYILAKFGKGPRSHQSDEESLSHEQRENNLTSTSFAEKKQHVSEVDGEQNKGVSSGYESQDNRKAGFQGGSWESAPENTQNHTGQRSRGHEEGHDDNSRETQQPDNDTETQREAPDQSFDGTVGKETGYDDPKADTGEKGGKEDFDEHGNET